MSGIRVPGAGPIVGHTTDHSCRLWIRAGDPDDEGAKLASERRTIGVLAVLGKRPAAKKNWSQIATPPAYYFRLHREFDRTGTFNLGVDIGLGDVGKPYPLDPDTDYEVRMGTLTIDDPNADDESIGDSTLMARLPAPEAWVDDLRAFPESKAAAVFRTFPEGNTTAEHLSFIVGSCRYPGLLWKVKHADRIFGPVRDEAGRSRKGAIPRFVLMVGDQIYADMFNRLIPIGLADTFEEFQDRYLTAFGSPNMRRLLRTIPTYMILDDHEIEDNWTQDRFYDGSKRFVFNVAMNAYMSYQWSHGPRNFGRRLHYSFDCGHYPFFVLDTRTQRFMDDVERDLKDNHLLGRPSLDPDEPNQLDRLLAWLALQQGSAGNAPKFIVSSSVFVPNPMSAREGASTRRKEKSDSWPAFPRTRRAILDCIVENGIQNVVFVSGDIHCSTVAQMAFSGADGVQDLRAFSVVSSAFYWPFPFADGEPSDYVHDSRAKDQQDTFKLSNGTEMDYKAWNFTQEDNFCRLDIDREKAQMTVTAFDTKGRVIERENAQGNSRRLVAKLKLARW